MIMLMAACQPMIRQALASITNATYTIPVQVGTSADGIGMREVSGMSSSARTQRMQRNLDRVRSNSQSPVCGPSR